MLKDPGTFLILVSTFCHTLCDDKSILQIYELKDIPKYKLKVGDTDSYLTEKDLHKPLIYYASLKPTYRTAGSHNTNTGEPIFDLDMIRALENSIENNLATHYRGDRRLKPDFSYKSVENSNPNNRERAARIFRPWINTVSNQKSKTQELVDKLTEILEQDDNGDHRNHLHLKPKTEEEEIPVKIRKQISL